jgi:hypothetical protein
MTLLTEAPIFDDTDARLGDTQDLEVFAIPAPDPAETAVAGQVEAPASTSPETIENIYLLTSLGQKAVDELDVQRLITLELTTGAYPTGLAAMLYVRHHRPDGLTQLDNHEYSQVFGTRAVDELEPYIATTIDPDEPKVFPTYESS